ncbi:MAG: histidine phosphatase family protein [Chitinophagaceae bacterium]|nr:MAG: histidine phosphatase family protein [Chitinophagaceae bacterium]
MKPLLFLLLATSLLACTPARYYVVRHAEKAPPAQGSDARDPQLSEAGKQRAETLAGLLSRKKIRQVFVTNTIRASSTAAPAAQQHGLEPQVYPGAADSLFIGKLRSLKGTTLVVGHSNTVDDIVNRLAGEEKVKGDLPESSFDRLFIITRRRGHYTFKELQYGQATP